MITSDMPLRKQIFSIPNMLGYFRILLLPLIVWRYVTADSIAEFHMAAVIIGITDFLDGFIARKFNMITNLGKIVDPVADKLTQAAIVFSLSFRFQWLIPVVVLFVIKEGFMGIMGVILLKKGKMLNGAKWFGKVSTAVLYVVMFILILAPNIQEQIANTLIVLSGFLLLMSFILYSGVQKDIERSIISCKKEFGMRKQNRTLFSCALQCLLELIDDVRGVQCLLDNMHNIRLYFFRIVKLKWHIV